MRSRWVMLAVLFAVRATMAFQFQSVAAVAPLLRDNFDIGIAGVGLLIGLYFTPGIVLALPGGAIGQRIGDKRAVFVGLGLMFAGGLIMTLWTSWSGQLAGRLVAGTGGVLLNVQMTKMVADWFVGREIATAMAIFVNSWPVGVAISLLLLPPIGVAAGVNAVYLTVIGLVACGMLLTTIYQPPPRSTAARIDGVRLDRGTLVSVIVAGSIWSLYNIGFAIIFSFGPSMLVERGWSITQAGAAISTVLWLAAVSVPLGGWLADRIGRAESVIVAGCVLSGGLLFAITRIEAVMPCVVALGLAGGLAAGPIMSLPARSLLPGTRAIGMGVFYTVFYLGMMMGPMLAGAYSRAAGTAAAAFDFGGAVALLCPALLWLFQRIALTRRLPQPV
ncbi:MAG: MFS transporter [Rhodopseudomonas sp.]|uniref:MFS transporter n=1 Tax=Rhodopseudomonas sp. TaxID=1078 RepID=UPI001843827A|nr:MFS transporter [Rhodopseudomonas sp.]NVN85145.1 MFS transporter [Rhodopseudomonas sp.]